MCGTTGQKITLYLIKPNILYGIPSIVMKQMFFCVIFNIPKVRLTL